MRSRGVLVAAVLAVGVLGGCGAPAVVAVTPAAPTGGTVDDPVIGVGYPFELLTHCGIQAANFAGHWWRATAPTDQPHPGGKGYTAGTMTLVSPQDARFDYPGGSAEFAPAEREPMRCA